MSIEPVVDPSPVDWVDVPELVNVPPLLESALPDVVPLVLDDVDSCADDVPTPVVPSSGALSD